MPRIDSILQDLLARKGSDLHVSAGSPPLGRVHGNMSALVDEILREEDTERILTEIMSPEVRGAFDKASDVDFAYETLTLGRFRVNVFRDRLGIGGVLRHVPTEIPTLEDLSMPPAVRRFAEVPRGIVLVTGPTGSGKSTTLAAIVDAVNTERSDHIITIEDPIEFIHQNKKSLVNQREVGTHTQSFASALRAALRQDPDVILVGEMRDLETTAMAIEAAETGHLVFGTLHTSSAATTVNRIIDQFPAEGQAQIRTQLASSLQGVVSQCLLRRSGGQGRVAALEILIGTPAVCAQIREGKTHQITSQIQTGGRLGMSLLNDSLVKLVSRGQVDPGEAYAKSSDKEGLLRAYQTARIPFVPDQKRTGPQIKRGSLVGSGGGR